MEEGVVAVDQSERILSINQAGARMFQLKSSKIQGRMIQEIIRHKELERFISRALAANKSIATDLTLYQNEERVLNAHTTPLKGAAQENIGILVVLNDVTQLRKLETMRRDFVANVSHEIKTPLTAIKGFVETLNQGAVSHPEESERFLGIIEKHVNRLTAIIDDLLKLSRIEQEEKDNIVLETRPIKGVLQSAIQVCQPKADAKNIQIQVDCENGISANMDVHLMEQAVVNLLNNAINYSENNSRILVTVGPSESEVVIRFQDQGIGIANEHLPRLFERFYRVDKARSRKLGGTGLGLSIVKHIVQAHGGQITVQSTPGKGTTFMIHLPKP
jgi:two-component system phosphate regulon sensor histidine kinase PhoR